MKLEKSHAARVPRISGEASLTEVKTKSGIPLIVESSSALPIVDIDMTFRPGAAMDPAHLAGLSRLAWRVFRRGALKGEGFKALSQAQIDEAIESLGARFGISIASGHVRLTGTVIRRNLEPFLALLSHMLLSPGFKPKEIARAKRDVIAELVQMRDRPRSLASVQFHRSLFGDHPYGRSIAGSAEAMKAIRREDILRTFNTQCCLKNAVVGIAGDVTAEDATDLVERYFGVLPVGKRSTFKVPAPKSLKGAHLVIVDKPELTQAQIMLGTLGIKAGDPNYLPLLVGNAALGGTFTSRLNQELREKRGWTYGAASRVGVDVQRDAFYMMAATDLEHASESVAIMQDQLDVWVSDGITAKEHRFAKSYLVNGRCFDEDTPIKRLSSRIDARLMGLDYLDATAFGRRVASVSRKQVSEAIQARISPKHHLVVVVAKAESVRAALEQNKRFRSVTVVPHTEV